MKHYLGYSVALMTIFLALFAAASWLDLTWLNDPTPILADGGIVAAGIGITMLIADVLIPVPTSLIMIAHGALFGLVGGTLISLAGAMGAAWLGFYLGRRGGPLLDRLIPGPERMRGQSLLLRWGLVAIVVSRPIPIVAETIVLLAGTSPMTWRQLTIASFAGALPSAWLFALTGATSVTINPTLWTWISVLILAGLAWWIGIRLQASHPREVRP